MCIYTVGSLWGAWTSVLIIEVSTFQSGSYGYYVMYIVVVIATNDELPVIDKAHDKLMLPLATSLTEDSALGSDQESCISTTATTGVACVDKVCHLIRIISMVFTLNVSLGSYSTFNLL